LLYVSADEQLSSINKLSTRTEWLITKAKANSAEWTFHNKATHEHFTLSNCACPRLSKIPETLVLDQVISPDWFHHPPFLPTNGVVLVALVISLSTYPQ
jgi:hypothetical protein